MPSTGGWERSERHAGVEGPRAGVLQGGRFVLFLPDLGLFVAFVTLFYCLFLFEGNRKLFRDSDTGWHIRTGEAILTTGSLPRTDPYSFTRQGEPWFAWEWGADVIMGGAHLALGLPGVAVLYLACIAACSWIWFRLHWVAGGDFFLACLMAAPMLSTSNLHWLARPHVFSWLFLLISLWFAETSPDRFRPRHAVTIAAFTALWANIHASFFFGAAIALIYAAGSALRLLVWNEDRKSAWRRTRFFLLAALCSAVGSFANPYGWALHRHLFAYLTNRDLLDRIGEFQSFNFHAEGAGQIVLMVGLAGIGTVLALQQRRVDHFLLAAALIVTSLRSARGLPLVALLVLPLANAAISGALREASGLRPRLAAWRDRYFDYSGRVRTIDQRLKGYALVPLVLILTFVVFRSPGMAAKTGFPPTQFPVAASTAVGRLPVSARLFAPDMYGGYLIYRFAGERKVFMDGRSDFYGVEFMKRYVSLVEVRPGWQKTIAENGITHALLPRNYSLAAALEREGWRKLYADETAILLEK